MKQYLKFILFAAFLFAGISCKKDWLNEKRDSSLLVPTTLRDFRLLLNNNFPMGNSPIGIVQVASDEYTTADNYYGALFYVEQLGYIWSDKTFSTVTYAREWDDAYQMVLQANVILDGLSKIKPDQNNQVEYNDIKGGALYLRARAFYGLTQIFTKPYDPTTAGSDLGIPLRLSADVNEKSVRASLLQTYDRIISDLKTAAGLLKITAAFTTDSSRPAANALLARCYLSMGIYDQALVYADLSLKDNDQLIDYNTLDPASYFPFPLANKEVVFQSPIPLYDSFLPPIGAIDQALYNSYEDTDLRKELFFVQNTDQTYSFRGSYTGYESLFGGIATDEQYLIRAECEARAGNVSAAIKDLNALLKKRYKTGLFTDYNISDQGSALSLILKERRKELLMRGTRWSDVRRLNREGNFKISIKKTVNGQTYTLAPNDPHYAFLIPEYIIKVSGIQQNPR